jgi:hypothetical protein
LRLSHRLVFYRRRPGSITARRDHRYAHQLVNLVAGTSAGLASQASPAKAIELAARKALIILLKGARIADRSERSRFFAACRPPLSDIAALVSGHGWSAVSAHLWLAACRAWLGLQRASGRA